MLIPLSYRYGAACGRKVLLPALLALAILGAECAGARAAITNSAVATASYGATAVASAQSTALVNVTPGVASLSVVKSASPTGNVVAGQTVTYTYVVKNTGTLTVTNVSPADTHNASGPAPAPSGETLTNDAGQLNDSTDVSASDGVWSVLAPGDTVTFTGTYTVLQSDVDQLQ
jgi:uncharacterized repeat protein (TIGR01451 family)